MLNSIVYKAFDHLLKMEMCNTEIIYLEPLHWDDNIKKITMHEQIVALIVLLIQD